MGDDGAVLGKKRGTPLLPLRVLQEGKKRKKKKVKRGSGDACGKNGGLGNADGKR